MKPNEKLQSLRYQVLWEVIYAYFYNWDWSLFLVLIVYVLVDQTEIFLSILIVFGKYFCFEKFQKFGKLCNFVLATHYHKSIQLHASNCELTQKLLQLFGESGPQSHKRLRKFSKIWVFWIVATQFGDWFASGSSSHKVYSKCLATPVMTYSRVELPVVKS